MLWGSVSASRYSRLAAIAAVPAGGRMGSVTRHGQPDGDAVPGQVVLGLGDRVLAVVEDAGGQGGAGPPSARAARRCSGLPAPPEATTGTSTASATARVIGRS